MEYLALPGPYCAPTRAPCRCAGVVSCGLSSRHAALHLGAETATFQCVDTMNLVSRDPRLKRGSPWWVEPGEPRPPGRVVDPGDPGGGRARLPIDVCPAPKGGESSSGCFSLSAGPYEPERPDSGVSLVRADSARERVCVAVVEGPLSSHQGSCRSDYANWRIELAGW
jgi:hypothetical protein